MDWYSTAIEDDLNEARLQDRTLHALYGKYKREINMMADRVVNPYENNLYRAEIVRVIDGDTIVADVDAGFNVRLRLKLRLAEINAPEVRGEEKIAGEKTAQYVEKRLKEAKEILVCSYKTGKYGRYIATIYLDGESLNDELVKNGYATRY